MNREIDVDLADARHRTHSRNSTNRLLALLIEHHDYSVRMPEGYVKPEPVVYVPPAEPTPEYKALWFGVPEPVNQVVTIDKIQRTVCKHYDIARVDLVSARRDMNVCRPRQVAMYLAKTLTPKSYPYIGRRFGGRDHTTALSAVRRIESKIQTDAKIANDVALLTSLLSPVMEAAE